RLDGGALAATPAIVAKNRQRGLERASQRQARGAHAVIGERAAYQNDGRAAAEPLEGDLASVLGLYFLHVQRAWRAVRARCVNRSARHTLCELRLGSQRRLRARFFTRVW